MIALLRGILQLFLFLIGLVIRLRLWPPAIYALLLLLVPPLSRWYAANTALAQDLFWALCGLVLLSWAYSLVRLLVLLRRERKQEAAEKEAEG